ncbi:TolC family outer membrane protein [soil metagenome]
MTLKVQFTFLLVCATFLVNSQPLLMLNDAIKQALENNYDVQIAKNDQSIADIQNNWGNAGRLPTVAATGGYNISNSNVFQKLNTGVEIERKGATLQSENAGITAQWRIFNGFRVTAAKRRLEEQEIISNLGVKQQANETVYNVIVGYLNLMRLQLERKALQETIALFQERMTLAQNRFTIGVAAKSDWLQAQVDFNEQQNSLLQNELDTKAAITNLNNLMARNADDNYMVTDTIERVNLPSRSNIIQVLDTLNPQLLIAKRNQLVLVQLSKEINAQRLPTLSLNTGVNLNNSNNSAGQLLRNTNYGPAAGLSLAVPIYSAGLVKQQLKVNSVQQKTQQVIYDQIKNDLQTSLANAFNSNENAQKKYALEMETLEVVKENNMIAMERFRKGSITTVELRQTQLNFIESQTRMINAMYQMKQAEADILLIMGRLVQ